MNESSDSQEDAAQEPGQDNLSQPPRDSESSSNRRRRIRDGGLGGSGDALPDNPRRWRDRFKP